MTRNPLLTSHSSLLTSFTSHFSLFLFTPYRTPA